MSRCLRICGAYSYRLSRRHSTVLLIVSFILTLTIILQLYSYRHHHPHIMTRPGDLEYKPGAFLKGHHPNENRSYCRFHYGLPNRFNLDNVTVHNSPEQGRRSQYRVIYNAITGITYANATKFNAVTYATQATPEFLYHIIEIARFWEGPISLAVYVPDFDLEVAMKIMNHLCRCYYGMSKVSMHLFFPSRYPPKLMMKDNLLRSISTTTRKPTTEINFEALLERKRSYKNLSSDARAKYIQAVREKNLKRKMARTQVVRGKMPVLEFKDCTGPSFLNVSTFRSQENLFYPVNIGRNVARNASRTNYFLVSDIELVPSEGLAPKFLTMVRKLMGDKKREEGCIFAKTVFVVPLFEVERGEEIPRDKETLVNLVAANRAVYFHQLVCTHCQRFPGLQTWLSRPSPRGVEPMVIGRREYPYHRWEPLYFGTQKEPWYSELLTWEGKQDKMTQMLELCLQEYRLVVLDGGFLSHAAIRLKKEEKKWERAERNNHKRYNEIVVKLKKKYKDIPQCKVI